jgi:ComEC/Rec2-related protein
MIFSVGLVGAYTQWLPLPLVFFLFWVIYAWQKPYAHRISWTLLCAVTLSLGILQGLSVKQTQTRWNEIADWVEADMSDIFLEGTVVDVKDRLYQQVVSLALSRLVKNQEELVLTSRRVPMAQVRLRKENAREWRYGTKVRLKGFPQILSSEYEGYRQYLRLHDYVVLLDRVHGIEMEPMKNLSLKGVLFQLRRLFEINLNSYQRVIGYKGVQVLKAVLLGERSGMPASLKEPFKKSGTYHVFAISGLHMMVFYLVLFALLSRVACPAKVAIGLVVITLGAIAILTGLSASVVRASLMLALGLLWKLSGRKVHFVYVFILSFLLIIIVSPKQMFLPGFQLSYVAVWGIILSRPIINRIDQWSVSLFWKRIMQTGVVFVSLAVMTAPLSAYYFGQVVLVSPLSNTLVILLMTVILVSGLLLLVLEGIGLGIVGQVCVGRFIDLMLNLTFAWVHLWAKCPVWSVDLSVKTVFLLYLLVFIPSTFTILRGEGRAL